ncbi:unnamed protein product [Adineta ricciae]|uniref:Uncharacterized protein n=1 Tax=Adineta ricciae TaxID=249248 RepID=A0A813T2W7_ADIRI|nr:unnamed protein product [Adineta ricciae]CAF1229437.1 unnamed protein product [Adineta ricciae]
MSDTSIASGRYSYDDFRRKRRSSSFCDRYWFHIATTTLVIINLAIVSGLGYIFYKETELTQQRKRIQNDFKQQHGLANAVLDLVAKDGFIAKWLKKNNVQIVTVFKELINDMVTTIFEQ